MLACCLPSVRKQKQLLDSVFVISRIIELSVRVISLSYRQIKNYLDFDYSVYHKYLVQWLFIVCINNVLIDGF